MNRKRIFAVDAISECNKYTCEYMNEQTESVSAAHTFHSSIYNLINGMKLNNDL